jgi:hypothetical protein
VFDIIKNFIYAVVLLLLWYGFHMNRETAQLRDFLALLHDEQAQCRAAILTLALTIFNGDLVSSTRCFVSSSSVHGFYGPMNKKSDTQVTAAPK